MRKHHTSSFFLLPSSFKKGSALLIVLGMLSFMVVSAVGFSIYMRSSRTPSSYLRRNVSARYLVRAALAKAIEDLEGNYNSDPDWGKVDDSETKEYAEAVAQLLELVKRAYALGYAKE